MPDICMRVESYQSPKTTKAVWKVKTKTGKYYEVLNSLTKLNDNKNS
jgi:hypothetical protein